MIIDKSHRGWIAATVVLGAISTGLYVWYASTTPDGPTGGSWQGLGFGLAGTVLMIFAGLLAGRKKVPRWNIGRAQTWLKGHIWLGLLSVPLIFFHSGWRFGGPLELALMLVFLAVIVSGVVGLALQQYLPRLLKTTAPAQAIYEQLPQACTALRRTADEVVVARCGSLLARPAAAPPDPGEAAAVATAPPVEAFDPEQELKHFYLNTVRPFLEFKPATARSSENGEAKASRLANETQADATFAQIREALPPSLHATVDQLQAVCEERRQLRAQQKIHHWLHGWLLLHVPLSLVLLVLGLFHVIFSAIVY